MFGLQGAGRDMIDLRTLLDGGDRRGANGLLLERGTVTSARTDKRVLPNETGLAILAEQTDGRSQNIDDFAESVRMPDFSGLVAAFADDRTIRTANGASLLA